MQNLQILVHGKHPDILQTVLRLINQQENWQGEGSLDEEVFIELFRQKKYDIVLLGGGILSTSEQRLAKVLQQINPDIKIIQHYGGGSGLLKSEIETALQAA